MAGQLKLKAVTELVKKLSDDLEKPTLQSQERVQALDQLKLYGRDPSNADPIFTNEGISMLMKHAFNKAEPEVETSRAALKVLANSMLLQPQTRKTFIEQEGGPKACLVLKREGWDDEFLGSRVLFLSTYSGVDLKELIEKHQLADRITDHLARHANVLSSKGKATADPMQDMALIESLKLLFNVTHFCESHISEFTKAVPHLVALLWKQDITAGKVLDGSNGQVINALLNIDLKDEKSQEAIFPEDAPTKVATRLIDLLDPAIRAYGDDELDVVVTPLINVLRKVHATAPQPVQQLIRKRLLPTAEDREKVLGQGDTLSAKLLKNSTHPTCQTFRDSISQLLFDMSDRDASRFVENVGYGLASGFLFQNNISMPPSAPETSNARDTERTVNPITGQFVDAENPVEEPEMTQEEKEREAERLFVLFERLKATGVMDVVNPVEAAMSSGSYRELRDDEVEELDD